MGTEDVARQAGGVAGRAFAAGFAEQLPRKRRARGVAAHRAHIRALQRDLAVATTRRG